MRKLVRTFPVEKVVIRIQQNVLHKELEYE